MNLRLSRHSMAAVCTAARIAFFAAALVLGIGGWQIMRTHDALLDGAERDARALSRALAQHAARTIEGVDLILSGAVERIEGNPDRDHLKAYLERSAGHVAQVADLMVTDATGQWIADTIPPHAPLNSADRDEFQWHRDHDDRDLHVGSPIVSRTSGNLVIPFSRRLNNADGQFAGIVRAVVAPEYLQKFYDSVHVGLHGSITLLNSGGRLLVRYPALLPGAQLSPVQTNQIANVVKPPDGMIRLISPLDGTDRIVGFEHVEGYPFVVTAGIAVSDALEGWRREALIEAIVLGTAAFGLIALGIATERHRRRTAAAEAASREIDGHYRLLAENSSDLIALKPAYSGARSYVSPSSRSVVGWEPDELAVLPLADWLHPDDAGRVAAEYASLTPEAPRVESLHRVRHKAGHYLWLETMFQLTGNGSVVVAARDVTARHEAQQRASTLSRYLLIADELAHVGYWRIDLPGMQRYWSDEIYRIYGFAPGPEAPSLEQVLAGYHPDDRATVERSVAAAIAGGPGFDLQLRLVRPDGEIRHVMSRGVTERDQAGEVTAVFGMFMDITDLKRMEAERLAAATRLEATLDAMDQGLIMADADGRIAIHNRHAFEMLGIRAQGPVGAAGQAATTPVARTWAELAAAGGLPWLLDSPFAGATPRSEHVLSDGRIIESRAARLDDGGEVRTFTDISHLKQAETRALDANRHLLIAEEIAHVGHWRIELPENRLTWSDEVYRIHGLDPKSFDLRVETAVERYHPDDRAEVMRCVSEAVSDRRSYAFKCRIRRPDGEVRYVLSRGLCEVDPETGSVRSIVGAILDVTELTQAERHVSEKSALLEAALDNMEQALVKVAADGTIELANRRFAQLLDLPANLLDTPRPNVAEVLGEHRARGDEAGAGGLNPATHRRTALALGTYECSRPDGTVLEVRTVPAPDGAVVRTYSDITARRKAEAARQESDERYRILAEATSDVITRLDLDMRREYVSPACRAVLGYDPADMLGVRPSASIHPDDAPAVRDLARRLVAGEIVGDRAITTYRTLHKQGHWIWLESGMNLVRDPLSGAPTSIICSLRDVTERQRAARHLERARAEAEQAALAKAEFVANMSHELRTPLTGILGVHDILRDDWKLTAAQRRLVNLATDSGRLLLNIVNDILDFSKIEAGQLAIETVPFALDAIIDDCRDLAADGLRDKPVRIEATYGPGLPGWFMGDPSRLRQVLLNFLTNAVKFTEQGRIGIEVAYRADAAMLRIDVTDTGIGIPTDKLPLLFERFSQADASTSRRYGGTGLGLAICKRLVELMDGQVGVDTEAGRGSRFWFELPLQRRGVSVEAAPSALSDDVRPPDRRILLAEDNPINQGIIVAMLTTRGHTVTAVSDGAAVIEAATSGPGFDVILMDMQMPYMDGLTATVMIRNWERNGGWSRTPIIGLTANAMMEDVRHCLDAGMDAHVAKPIDWAKLQAEIDRVACKPEPMVAPPSASPAAAPPLKVLDDETLETLERVIGGERLAKLLREFAVDLDRRLGHITQMDATELAAQTHSLRSLAGQLGCAHLSTVCAAVEDEARLGGGLHRIGELRSATVRALSAVRSSRFVLAA